MSVTADALVVWRPWAYNRFDPGLPSGIWFSQAAVAGDASGGFAEIVIELQAISSSVSGRLYSIEKSQPSINGASADQFFRGVSFGMDPLASLGPIQKVWIQEINDVGVAGNPNAASIARDIDVDIFLGAQILATSQARLNGQFNNANGDTFAWFATGYIWDPGAVNAPLGLRKPLGGVL